MSEFPFERGMVAENRQAGRISWNASIILYAFLEVDFMNVSDLKYGFLSVDIGVILAVLKKSNKKLDKRKSGE